MMPTRASDDAVVDADADACAMPMPPRALMLPPLMSRATPCYDI